MIFEKGDGNRPKGHALIYWRNTTGAPEYLASYLDIPPLDQEHLLSVPIVIPVDQNIFERLKEVYINQRGADLIDGGVLDPTSNELKGKILEIMDEYSRRYRQSLSMAKSDVKFDLDDLTYSILTEKEKLGRLTKLTGQLRDAVCEDNFPVVKTITAKLKDIASYLSSEKYRINDMVEAAQIPGIKGQELTELHIKEFFYICDENYEEAEKLRKTINKRINELWGDP